MMSESQESPNAAADQGPDANADVKTERTVADVEAEMAAMKDQLLRALAETENARRRAEREAQDGRVYAIERFAKDMLTIADNLGRALGSASAPSNDPAFATLIEGVRMTDSALQEMLAKHGIRKVGAKGDKFDPNIHQAVSQIPSDAPAGCLAEVLQPGYVLADRTLRAAMVMVSQGAGGGETQGVDVKV